MPTTVREPLPELCSQRPARDQAVDNLAVVSTWWKVLESEWRAALTERAEGILGFAMVDPRLRAAVAPFDQFDAVVDDLLAFGKQVVISVSLRGRIAGRELAAREAWVCLLDEGAVLDVRQFPCVQEALAAVTRPAPDLPLLTARL